MEIDEAESALDRQQYEEAGRVIAMTLFGGWDQIFSSDITMAEATAALNTLKINCRKYPSLHVFTQLNLENFMKLPGTIDDDETKKMLESTTIVMQPSQHSVEQQCSLIAIYLGIIPEGFQGFTLKRLSYHSHGKCWRVNSIKGGDEQFNMNKRRKI